MQLHHLSDSSSPGQALARTPLPYGQLAILLFLRFTEAASAYVIFPFLNELLAKDMGFGSKAGYYAGLLESSRQLVSLVCVMYWSRLSDLIGRKPVLFIGIVALAVSTTSFGLSRTFWALVLSRCIFTALNSNSGVIKSMVGEITDQTNRADAFGLLHVPWAIGSSFGAFTGGWLAHPNVHFPGIFKSYFWINYPYLLPCSVVALLAILACCAIVFFLKETVKIRIIRKASCITSDAASRPLLQSTTPYNYKGHSEVKNFNLNDEPVSLQALLHPRIMLPLLNYVCLASLHAASNSIQPLFLAMPVDIGGLGLPPRDVGYIFGAYGIMNSLFQTFVLARLVRRFGVKTVFLTGVSMFVPMFAFSPLMNIVVGVHGPSHVVWIMLACQLFCSLFMELSYGCIYMFITAAAPNQRSLGATNGLGQTLVSIGRIATPIMAMSLLSLSIEHHFVWGYAAQVVLIGLSLGGIWLASQLPRCLD